MTTDRSRALTAGLLYFSTHITSVAAVVFYGSTLDDPFAGSDTRILIGVLVDVLLALGCLGTGIVLLPLLKRYRESLAEAFAHLRSLEAAVILAGVLPMLALLEIRTMPESSVIAGAMVELHQASFLIGQGLVISVNSIIIGYLLWKSAIVPQFIGVLGMVGGGLVLVGNFLQFFGGIEQGGTIAGLLAVAVFAFEICFAGYMVLKGVRTETVS